MKIEGRARARRGLRKNVCVCVYVCVYMYVCTGARAYASARECAGEHMRAKRGRPVCANAFSMSSRPTPLLRAARSRFFCACHAFHASSCCLMKSGRLSCKRAVCASWGVRLSLGSRSRQREQVTPKRAGNGEYHRACHELTQTLFNRVHGLGIRTLTRGVCCHAGASLSVAAARCPAIKRRRLSIAAVSMACTTFAQARLGCPTFGRRVLTHVRQNEWVQQDEQAHTRPAACCSRRERTWSGKRAGATTCMCCAAYGGTMAPLSWYVAP